MPNGFSNLFLRIVWWKSWPSCSNQAERITPGKNPNRKHQHKTCVATASSLDDLEPMVLQPESAEFFAQLLSLVQGPVLPVPLEEYLKMKRFDNSLKNWFSGENYQHYDFLKYRSWWKISLSTKTWMNYINRGSSDKFSFCDRLGIEFNCLSMNAD